MSGDLREQVWTALGGVRDPCMIAAGHDLSIMDLGLVYGVEVEDGAVEVLLTFTEPGCMFTHRVVADVYDALEALPGVDAVKVTPRWNPVWTEDRMNEKARLAFSRGRSALRVLPVARTGP